MGLLDEYRSPSWAACTTGRWNKPKRPATRRWVSTWDLLGFSTTPEVLAKKKNP